MDSSDESEMPNQGWSMAVREFSSLREEARLSLFVTCTFSQRLTTQLNDSLVLEIRATQDDVQKYLDEKIMKLPSDVSCAIALREDIMNYIVPAANGVFLLARLYFHYLTETPTLEAIRLALNNFKRDQQLSGYDGNESQKLQSAYYLIMQRIECKNQGDRTTLSAIEAFGILKIVILTYPRYEGFESRLGSNAPYDYAARNWGEHARYSQKVPRDFTAIHVAAYFGLKEMMISLIADGNDLDLKDTHGRTPLSYAAENGHESTVLLLLESGHIDANSVDANNRTPLSWAVEYGHRQAVRSLLSNGAKVDIQDIMENPDKDIYGQTALSHAAAMGYEPVVQLILSHPDVDLDSEDINGRTPLSHAAANRNFCVVQLLLGADGVNPDSKDINDITPLSHAAANGYKEVVQFLVNTVRVHPDSKDVNGITPLSRAAVNGHISVVRTLLDVDDVDPESKGIHGQTPCMRAAAKGHTTVMQSLQQAAESRRVVNVSRLYLDQAVEYVKQRQRDSPWQREGSQTPPVRRLRSASAMTKGKLLTTPSRLLKLILPVTTSDYNGDRKDVEPLALLLHPQQPLSYLERLIQAEVPPVQGDDGQLRPPQVSFFAVEIQDEHIKPKGEESHPSEKMDPGEEESPETLKEPEKEDIMIAGQKSAAQQSASNLRGGPGEGGVEMYGDMGGAEPQTVTVSKDSFVRWSSSTEIGDFIRDAARVKEFQVDIQGSPMGRISVGVPSFNDRTYYLRMRLRKISKKLKQLAIIKQECDTLAHRGGQRVALGGLGVMVTWWFVVYKLTFETDYGWDTMEPITYLVSLSTLMGGYTWFLYHNREISYRSALDFTINRRQQQLYQAKGIDLQLWESLIEEANALRRETKTVAEEYDVDWNEKADEQDERVTEALKHQRKHKERKDRGRKKEGEEKDTHGDH
ncbi:Kinase D-interacting substrate of 220 kDa [Talaromyces islandicus]|uniref:protein S-acyltransferase n=1 Tax=Talaromyces islandicus TaxID=28573 RepID=A0A0U1MBF9_TALIS|nr:Kinase D-interacting substrate of 220 kDa [Talaromyces islandicus]